MAISLDNEVNFGHLWGIQIEIFYYANLLLREKNMTDFKQKSQRGKWKHR